MKTMGPTAIQGNDDEMWSPRTKFRARRVAMKTWEVDWLPGELLTADRAYYAMLIAETLGQFPELVQTDVFTVMKHPERHILVAMANEVGMSAQDMVTAWNAANPT